MVCRNGLNVITMLSVSAARAPAQRVVSPRATASNVALGLRSVAAVQRSLPSGIWTRVPQKQVVVVRAAGGSEKKFAPPKIEIELDKLVNYNFLIQVVLAGVSWATIFFTTHVQVAQGAQVLTPPTVLLIAGTILSGYSAYLAFKIKSEVDKGGKDVLSGFKQLKPLYDHITINFIGAFATIVALHAQVGSITMGAAGAKALSWLTQAAANTLLAHLVSILFLALALRKVTEAAEKIVAWSEQLKTSLPSLA